MPPKKRRLRIVKKLSTTATSGTAPATTEPVSPTKTISREEMIEKYLKEMPEIERQAMEIAVRQLESSFCIEKSIGFLKFVENFKNQ